MDTKKRLTEAEHILGYTFRDSGVLLCALTHPSAVSKHQRGRSYERLEFLGDSILGAIVASELFSRFSEMDEGDLTQIKISLVSGPALAEVSGELGLSPLIVRGDSEKGCEDRGMASALENVFEALVGALYLDGGLEAARSFVLRCLEPRINPELSRRTQNPKSLLQEICQKQKGESPVYVLIDEQGPAHSPTFVSTVEFGGQELGRGRGSSKKSSEVAAAEDALVHMASSQSAAN